MLAIEGAERRAKIEAHIDGATLQLGAVLTTMVGLLMCLLLSVQGVAFMFIVLGDLFVRKEEAKAEVTRKEKARAERDYNRIVKRVTKGQGLN